MTSVARPQPGALRRPWLSAEEPHLLCAWFERYFAGALMYRTTKDDGTAQYVIASLSRARWLPPQDADTSADPGRWVSDWLDRQRLRAAGEATGGPDPSWSWCSGDLLFGLSYELGAVVAKGHASERPLTPAAVDPAARAFAAPIVEAVLWDESSGEVEVIAPTPTRREEITLALETGRAASAELRGFVENDPAARLTDIRDQTRARYASAFAELQDELRDGEIYQGVLSVDTYVVPKLPLPAYFASVARRYQDAAYHYWIGLPRMRMIGCCSLPHVELRSGRLSTRVFAGTRPREEDPRAATASFRADDRFYAEHVMLVDVERNDLSTVCVPGTVSVPALMNAHAVGPTLYLSSEVAGTLRPDLRWSDAVLANFPRTVVVGAPKVSAIDVVARLEGRARHFYTGVTGYVSDGGQTMHASTNVTSAVQAGDELLLQCAGGITAGSTVAVELEEQQMKLRYLV